MNANRTVQLVAVGIVAWLFVFGSACRKEEPAPAAPEAAAPAVTEDTKTTAEAADEPKTATETVSDEVKAKLAKADAADGATDNVISKCPSCNLKMDGDAANAVPYAGYALHFCSPTCKEHFEAEPDKILAALTPPEGD